jgi:hypothetical protein
MTFDWNSMTSDTAGVLATIVAAVFIPFLLVAARIIRENVPNPLWALRVRVGLWILLAFIAALSIWVFTKTEFDLLNVMNHSGAKRDSAAAAWVDGLLGILLPLVFLALFSVGEGVILRRARAVVANAEDED